MNEDKRKKMQGVVNRVGMAMAQAAVVLERERSVDDMIKGAYSGEVVVSGHRGEFRRVGECLLSAIPEHDSRGTNVFTGKEVVTHYTNHVSVYSTWYAAQSVIEIPFGTILKLREIDEARRKLNDEERALLKKAFKTGKVYPWERAVEITEKRNALKKRAERGSR